MASFTLYLDNEFLQVFQCKRKQWVRLTGFPRTREGHLAFALFLQNHPQANLSLLLNLPHEQIVQESIPDIRGKDRQALILRRLEQHFPGTPFRMAEPIQGGETARGEIAPGKVRWQFSAFTRHEDLVPWLDAVTRQQARLQGIYSVTQLNGALLKRLQADVRPCLLLIRDGQTLHQYFIRAQQTSLCRHLLLPEEDDDFLLRESGKLQQFLINQHQIKRDDLLPTYLLGFHQETLSDLATEMVTLAPNQPLVELYLNASTQNQPNVNFAPPEYLKSAQLARIRRATTLTTSIFVLGSMTYSVMQLFESDQQKSQINELTAQIRQIESPTAAPDSSSSALSLPQLRQITHRHQSLTTQQHSPERLMIWFSQALERHPTVEIGRLEWRNDDGQEQLRIEGGIEGTEASSPEKILDDFLAVLSVDRNIPIRLISSGKSGEIVVRGSSAQPFSPIRHLSFVLEMGAQP